MISESKSASDLNNLSTGIELASHHESWFLTVVRLSGGRNLHPSASLYFKDGKMFDLLLGSSSEHKATTKIAHLLARAYPH